jgi:hypothetical protein
MELVTEVLPLIKDFAASTFGGAAGGPKPGSRDALDATPYVEPSARARAHLEAMMQQGHPPQPLPYGGPAAHPMAMMPHPQHAHPPQAPPNWGFFDRAQYEYDRSIDQMRGALEKQTQEIKALHTQVLTLEAALIAGQKEVVALRGEMTALSDGLARELKAMLHDMRQEHRTSLSAQTQWLQQVFSSIKAHISPDYALQQPQPQQPSSYRVPAGGPAYPQPQPQPQPHPASMEALADPAIRRREAARLLQQQQQSPAGKRPPTANVLNLPPEPAEQPQVQWGDTLTVRQHDPDDGL